MVCHVLIIRQNFIILERAGQLFGVWPGLQMCQNLCDYTANLLTGDEGIDDAHATLSFVEPVQDISNNIHGNSSAGIFVK